MESSMKRDIRNELELCIPISKYDINSLVDYIYDNLDDYYNIGNRTQLIDFCKNFKLED